MSDSPDLEKLVEAIRTSLNYRRVDEGLIRAVGKVELGKRGSFKEALKATKNKLHQVGGAYLDQSLPYDQWMAELSHIQNDPTAIQALCVGYLEKHASTRERLSILEEFYPTLFEKLPPIQRVVDFACGLNPLALPWMELPAGSSYHAYDIYQDMTDFLDGFVKLWGMEGGGYCRDVLSDPPPEQADLTLLLKAIPCLEQINKNAGRLLLDAIRSPWLIASFPIASLGGRDKGMLAHYEAHFELLMSGRGWETQKVIFATELAFVVRTHHAG